MGKILLVDGSRLVREIFSSELAEQGHQVTAVPRLERVAETLKSLSPDLIVLGLNYGRTEWRSLLYRIRSLNYNVPVILWSTFDGYRYDPARTAADYFVLKSADHDEIMEKVRRAIEGNNNPNANPRIRKIVDRLPSIANRQASNVNF